MQFASGTTGPDLSSEGRQRLSLRGEDLNDFWNAIRRRRNLRNLNLRNHGNHRNLSRAPLRLAAEAIDTELAEELEMVAELISGHDQRDARLPARDRSSCSTRSRMMPATPALL